MNEDESSIDQQLLKLMLSPDPMSKLLSVGDLPSSLVESGPSEVRPSQIESIEESS